jgi:YesN/AraC family two-component response regulator
MNRKLEVVVVDDEEQITELLRTFILCITKEIRIHTFNDSVDAKDYIARNPVDVLITDYKMPRLDGLQLMESAPTRVRKIMISGFVSEIAEEKLQKLNATFFEKPVPLRAVAKIISEQQEKLARQAAS